MVYAILRCLERIDLEKNKSRQKYIERVAQRIVAMIFNEIREIDDQGGMKESG